MNNGEHPLVKERRQRNLTQKDLAVRTRLSARTIWCAENNISISLDSRKRICTYLKKTAEELGLNTSDTATILGKQYLLNFYCYKQNTRQKNQLPKMRLFKGTFTAWIQSFLSEVDQGKSDLSFGRCSIKGRAHSQE